MARSFACGVVVHVYAAAPATGMRPDFVTAARDRLELTLDGIAGDIHAGPTRRAGAREPWIPRGATLRNDRQLSALSTAELAEVAAALALDALPPEWIGGNLLIDGLDRFSRIAPGSRLAFGGVWAGKGRFDGGAILRVEAYNHPCRQAGRAIASLAGKPDAEFAFVRAAAALRGLVLSVDLAGPIAPGDAVVVLPPVAPKTSA